MSDKKTDGKFTKNNRGRPSNKARMDAMLAKMDALVGKSSGFGMPGMDKTLDHVFQREIVSDIEARELWLGNDIAKRVIELVPSEMYREGFEIKAEKKDVADEIMTYLGSINAVPRLRQAKMYERAYGGAALYPVLNDAESDLSKPLNEGRVVELKNLLVFEPRELTAQSYYSELEDPKFGYPEVYQLQPVVPGGMGGKTIMIHESRLIIWRGLQVSRDITGNLRAGWGENVLTLLKSALRGFDLTWQAISVLICDFAQAVIKMKNLANLLAQGKIDEVRARAKMTEYTRSVVRAVMIDTEEEYGRETTNVAGLPELADRISSRLAAAANMPLTLMMGQSPKGLGNEGDSDLEWFYNQVGGMQVEDTEKVERLCELAMMAKDGPTGGQILEDYSIEWRPLFQPTDESTANARFLQSQTDEKYVTMGALSADDVANSRFGGEKYSYETTVDWVARQKRQAEAEKMKKELLANPPAPVPGQPTPAPAPQETTPKAG
jgi:phage-related protein (TIGR01555 family)